MRPDFCLHGLRTRHGSLAAHGSRRPPQERRSRLPDRIHSRRSHVVFREVLIKRRKVSSLLVVHVLHQRPEVRMRTDNRAFLRRVDQSSSQFTCLIDSHCTVEVLALLLV